MLGLTASVTLGAATSYGGSVGVEAWRKGMARHVTLMVHAAAVGLARRSDASTLDADVTAKLARMCFHLGCRRGCQPGVGLGELGQPIIYPIIQRALIRPSLVPH
ncbi:hypothetical protein BHE74_00051654 [Ensete ventricosum]|nr:hypothetical protein BHE74_00051654 [Ensete ventricosum]